jgi:predicted nicotinamide N-methyase
MKMEIDEPIAASSDGFSLDHPSEMSKEDYQDLLKQIESDFSKEECQQELLDAARYNDVDVVRALLNSHRDLHTHAAPNGNTALHMAAANGNLTIVQLLLHVNADATCTNEAGNTPLHWASQNGHGPVVQALLEQQNVDVLKRNQFGRSALTEGFTSENTEVVKVLLEHDSASEELLMQSTSTPGDQDDTIAHEFLFGNVNVQARERAMAKTKDDSILGQEKPEDDTTGLGIWAASLVAAQWMARQSLTGRVLELGAGCGLPSLVVANNSNKANEETTIYVTDFNKETVANLDYNLKLNNCANAQALEMNWQDQTTWPPHKMDVVIGSDLIYQVDMVPLLLQTIKGLLTDKGRFLYVAPETGRQGQEVFFQAMKESFELVSEETAPKEYTSNPLANQDEEECFLHFHELDSFTYRLYEFQWKA